MPADDPGGLSLPQGGIEFSWPAAEIGIEDILAAADRRARYLAGEEIPGRPERKSRAVGRRGRVSGKTIPAPADVGLGAAAGGAISPVPAEDDPHGEDAVAAALSGAGSSVSLADLAGHALIEPGPALAGWLSCAPCADLDDAGLVTSITGWRKMTSWAQAQELAAVAELAGRRGTRAEAVSCQDPVQKLEAEFTPSEVALALTLTQGSAEYWLELAVSMTRRLPGTMAALRSGRIDLARAKLIETFTTCLDDDLAGRVERMVLDKAEHRTTGQLRAALQRAVITVDPAAAERRREEAERNARVELSGDPESTGSLAGRFLPAGHAAAAWSRICALAKALESAGAPGGIDLLRAQVFVGLLLGTLQIIPPPLDKHGADYVGPDDDGGSPADDGGDDGPGDGGPGRHSGPGEGGPGDSGPSDDPGKGDAPGDSGVSADDIGSSSSGPDADRPWLAQPRDEDAPAELDDRDDADDRDADREIRGLSPPECQVRAGPLALAWPEIPLPGAIPAPGCAPVWPDRIPSAEPGATEHPGHQAGQSQPGLSQSELGQSGLGQPGLGQSGLGQPGRGQAGWKPAGRRVPVGAMTLTVPLRTLAGLTGEPGQLGRLGAVTGQTARGLAAAAAANPACEWKIFVIGTSGQAIAITRLDKRSKARCGFAPDDRRSPGWVSRIIMTVRATDLAPGGLAPGGLATGGLATGDLLDREKPPGSDVLGKLLDMALEAAAKTLRTAARAGWDLSSGMALARSLPAAGPPAGCGHAGAVSGYRIPDSMRRLIEARDQTCRFPVCRLPAWRTEMDHTIPYDLGGPTCRCNVSAECKHHHRVKHSQGWRLSQHRPGFLLWATPARLTYPVAPDPHPA